MVNEIEDLSKNAISFLIVAVIITIGAIIITGVGNTTKTGFTTSAVITITATNATEVFLGEDDLSGVNSIARANDSKVLGAGNFTVNLATGGVTFAFTRVDTFNDFNAESVNASVSFYEKGAWYNATLIDGEQAILNISKFNPTIAVIIVAAIVVMIVMGAFVMFRRP